MWRLPPMEILYRKFADQWVETDLENLCQRLGSI